MAQDDRDQPDYQPPLDERREAQDRRRNPRTTQGQAESPVDWMEVEAPAQQDNERGHRRIPQRDE